MASACKKRRFRDPQSVETSIDNVRKGIPQTTRYKNRWGLRIFEDWQSGRQNKAVICENNPFSLDLQNLQNLDTHLCSMTARTLNFWLIKFVQEVCDKDGEPYPGRTVYQIICLLKRHLEENGRAEANMLNANNHCFQTFRRVLDSEMKATHRAGESIAEKRTRKEKEGITDDEERLLWSKDLLGDKTAQSLVYTIYFYIGKIFGLRACEHRELRLSNFVIGKNKICYRENISKTFHGGLKDLKKKPRMVTHYCHEEDDSVHEPCLVEIFKQYISLVRELPKIDESFYFRPSKTAYKFENAPIGIHKLNSIVPFLMKEAGLEVKTAHCLRVTTATNLFRAGYQEKLIRERTGHVSSALFTYEKPNNDQAMGVSRCVGPCVSKDVSVVGNCFKPLSKPKENEKFDISDEELSQ